MNGITQRKKNLLMVCALWGLLLAVLALQPEKVVEFFLPTDQARNFAHVAAYGILAFLGCLYGKFKRNLFGIHLSRANLVLLIFTAVTLMGGGTEYLQTFTQDRTSDLADVFFDMIGAALGILSFYGLRGVL